MTRFWGWLSFLCFFTPFLSLALSAHGVVPGYFIFLSIVLFITTFVLYWRSNSRDNRLKGPADTRTEEERELDETRAFIKRREERANAQAEIFTKNSSERYIKETQRHDALQRARQSEVEELQNRLAELKQTHVDSFEASEEDQ